ncbi:hypothetical protein PTSG_12927 [Salpingoeca rosetta]|uniref:SIS domain-containing protein n=1 Tax=Salpingoeca rosetta (strain ATCC 50818 / BSB-021) TaxID=946362 RepID=F2UP41_SALR5|nr:uncharacterized protein PTSG_12927 [Salpingoeca rosetta]EGD79396.1 hypothetical protein PTSG_12927 [Salpingoeca rosetta]|eukprot:XP_004989165.1 hypothetical protein PTSG_12927 [Salpingoeca rosetta]
MNEQQATSRNKRKHTPHARTHAQVALVMMEEVRITELANELSNNLDAVGPTGIARIIRQADQQIFTGWRHHPAIYDQEIVSRLSELRNMAEERLLDNIVKGEKNVFVFSGCGTSGRIAWLCARSYNRILHQFHPELQRCFRYCISGGDQSLVISNELPEDDPSQGAADLLSVTEDCDGVMFFGVTCGLSAPYVAGQIEAAMHMESFVTSLIGFNPVHLARDAHVENWERTCKDVFLELESLADEEDDHRHWILNPIVGPEALTGSSRMKGGSATKVLLDAIFLPALRSVIAKITTTPASLPIQTPTEAIVLFERTARQAHHATDALASLVSLAGSVLAREDASLCYVGIDSAGLIGLLDASEMVDTYGCREDQVQTYVRGGWAVCENNEGDMTSMGPAFHLNLDHFLENVLPTLQERDGIILLSIGDDQEEHPDLGPLLAALSSSPAAVGSVHVARTREQPEYIRTLARAREVTSCAIACDILGVCNEPVFAHFALKLALNVITTGANVLRGAVYHNGMINLTVSNNKLFHRSAEIVAKLAECSTEHAKECLLKAVYETDELSPEIQHRPLSSHIEVATPLQFIVPKATLLARSATIAEAKQLLSQGQPLRSLIARDTQTP